MKCLVFLIFAFASCHNHRDTKELVEPENKSSLTRQKKPEHIIPSNKLLRALGEPTGKEIENYSFYLLFYKTTAFENLELYSILGHDETVYSRYKVTPAFNIRLLQEDKLSDSAVSYSTKVKELRKICVDEIRQLADSLNIRALHKTEGKVTTANDGDYLGLLIFDNNQFIMIDRLGTAETWGANYLQFFRIVSEKYF